MKRRLRKKLRLGEFRELMFSVAFKTLSTLSPEERDALLDAFIEMIEDNGLQFGGGGLDQREGFVALESRGSPTEQHRQAVRQWLAKHPQIYDIVLGDQVDAWHGWD